MTGTLFFAVYDGHGGKQILFYLSIITENIIGGTVAKFTGNNLHRRLTSEESYIDGQWDDALKKAFLGTDEDIRAGMY